MNAYFNENGGVVWLEAYGERFMLHGSYSKEKGEHVVQVVQSSVASDCGRAYAEGRKDEAEAGAWHPIETAPKDGTEIIGYANGDVRVCSWEALDNPVAKQWGIEGTWHRRNIPSGKSLLGLDFRPTHWMPLPGAPK